MIVELDGEGPLYRQLTRALKTAVQSGQLGAGARLPATRELALQLGVSRNTVRVAYEQLMAEGFFQGRAGSGSFVAQTSVGNPPRKAARPAGPQSAFARRLRAIGDIHMGRLHRGLRFNLQYGEPIHDLAAISGWRRELGHAASHTSPNYPVTQGALPLREAVSDYLVRRRGMHCTADDVVIVHGTQQAMSLTAQVLLDPGDSVVIEDPHYFSSRHVLMAHGAKIAALPVDGEGLVCRGLAKYAPKAVFVSPAHQFPSGSLMSMRRRIELLRFAGRAPCWVFEDDYDSEFRFGSQPMPALAALDVAGRVIYSGSFSKVMFPSLRMGYMVVPAALREDFVRAKRIADLGSPAIEQAAMARYLASGRFERHLRRVVQIGKARRKALLDGLARVGMGQFSVQDSEAGMHVVAWMPHLTHAQCDRLIATAAERGLGLHPILPHYRKPPAMPGLLLGYAALSVAEIDAAMKVLGAALKTVVATRG